MKKTYKDSAKFLLAGITHDMKHAGHRVLHEPKSMATIIIGERSESSASIASLQTALAQRFGTAVSTDTGRATLSVAHDRVELTNRNGRIIATDFESVTALIGSREPAVRITVTLDRLATELVVRYADENDREIADVVNGVIAGNLGHALERGNFDDSLEHTLEYVMEAIGRRKGVKIMA